MNKNSYATLLGAGALCCATFLGTRLCEKGGCGETCGAQPRRSSGCTTGANGASSRHSRAGSGGNAYSIRADPG